MINIWGPGNEKIYTLIVKKVKGQEDKQSEIKTKHLVQPSLAGVIEGNNLYVLFQNPQL